RGAGRCLEGSCRGPGHLLVRASLKHASRVTAHKATGAGGLAMGERRSGRRVRLPVLVALLAFGSHRAWALAITACNTTVPPRETGVLQADLLCAGEFAGVTLENFATLDMNGHSIRGPAVKGVICTERNCAVMSSVPGSERSGTL